MALTGSSGSDAVASKLAGLKPPQAPEIKPTVIPNEEPTATSDVNEKNESEGDAESASKSRKNNNKKTSSKKTSHTKNKDKGGRPPKDESKKTTEKVNTYLTKDDYVTLKEAADNEDQTVANFVRKIIKDYLKSLG